MKPLILESGRSRILFTPENGGLVMTIDGAGLTQHLSVKDCKALAAMLITSAKHRNDGKLRERIGSDRPPE
jgi:hypothetical protein